LGGAAAAAGVRVVFCTAAKIRPLVVGLLSLPFCSVYARGGIFAHYGLQRAFALVGRDYLPTRPPPPLHPFRKLSEMPNVPRRALA
jgi:hypothetical protein